MLTRLIGMELDKQMNSQTLFVSNLKTQLLKRVVTINSRGWHLTETKVALDGGTNTKNKNIKYGFQEHSVCSPIRDRIRAVIEVEKY